MEGHYVITMAAVKYGLVSFVYITKQNDFMSSSVIEHN